MYMYMHTQTFIRLYVYMCQYVNTHVHTSIYICQRYEKKVYINIHLCTYVYTYMSDCMYIYKDVCIHYMYIHI